MAEQVAERTGSGLWPTLVVAVLLVWLLTVALTPVAGGHLAAPIERATRTLTVAGRLVWFAAEPVVALGQHATDKHGVEAEMVRGFFLGVAARQGEAFWNQPPCKDGRVRFVGRMRDGRWAVWVLEKIAEVEYAERTAFLSDEEYARSVGRDCKEDNQDWYGHVYGG